MHSLDAISPDGQRVVSVGELTLYIKDLLEGSLPSVWVAGEICDFARPRSGHCYLTLKDDQAQLPAVIWRSTAARIRFELRDGLQVVCRGHVSVYPPHGRYQLVIQEIQPQGVGALERALRQLHARLAAEGLFAAARKRALPRFVGRVAVVTSPTGAALGDFLEVLRRRWRLCEVLVFPVRVQGPEAAREIVAAVGLVGRLAVPVDCLVLARGGGSLEDLAAFNEESVVRAIHGSPVPVVSAVGHDIDVTLADLAADVRALTPSEAAERVAPAADEIAAMLRSHQQRMAACLAARREAARRRLEAIAGRPVFRRPYGRVREAAQRLDSLELRARGAVGQRLKSAQQSAAALAGRLESLSPLAVLGRGYSLTDRGDDGPPLRDAVGLSPGDPLRTRFAQGRAYSRVERVEPGGG
jgi:exodeoxyribonuclease VII large subunit